jgi:UDP-N-acetylmuramyl pentapeptide phosphotransferase/UDP-N-acetylglucosamine-1-phosphate transferase
MRMTWVFIAGSVGMLSWWLTGFLAARGAVLGPVDHPNDRSLHHAPTPKMGGVAVTASAMLGLIVSGFTGFSRDPGLVWIVAGVLFLAAISFWDDRKGIPIWLRLTCHITAAAAVVFAGNVRLSVIHLPGFAEMELGSLAALVTMVFLVWMTNLYNFMDGMDGFAGGMTVVGFGMMAYLFWTGHQQALFSIALMQAAAALGFLKYNFPPAKIFMGDVGSISTGFLAGSLAILGCREEVFDVWVPLVIFSPFIVDATATVIGRAVRGERIWKAHREHYYQRLVLAGWSHRRTVTVEYGVMLCCGLLALMYQLSGDVQRVVILGVWMTLFLILAGLVHRQEVNGGH